MIAQLSKLLSAAHQWRVKTVDLSITTTFFHCHLIFDTVTLTAISKMEFMVTHYLKNWLHFPRSATHVIQRSTVKMYFMLQEKPSLAIL